VRPALGHRERALRAMEGRAIDRVATLFRAEQPLCRSLAAQLGTDRLEDYFDVDITRVALEYTSFRVPDLCRVTGPDDVDALPWPDGASLDLPRTREKVKEGRASGRAVASGAWASLFTIPRRSMGEERFLVALHEEPALVERIIERVAGSFLRINERFFQSCAPLVDIFYFGSDFGTQLSMFIGPEHFRRYFKPHMKRLVDHAKGFGQKVMFHTCGAVAPIVDDLIDIGVDALDPVQVSAAGMGPAELAGRFKGRIAFHGGISTQTTLPRGSPADVRSGVRETIRHLGPSGLIVGPDQDMIGDIPTGNVLAMYEAARAFPV
jgi:uroporphyrinogen decarboxylase